MTTIRVNDDVTLHTLLALNRGCFTYFIDNVEVRICDKCLREKSIRMLFVAASLLTWHDADTTRACDVCLMLGGHR